MKLGKKYNSCDVIEQVVLFLVCNYEGIDTSGLVRPLSVFLHSLRIVFLTIFIKKWAINNSINEKNNQLNIGIHVINNKRMINFIKK